MVFVSVPPQKNFAEQIGGDQIQVRLMVQPGHNPATYDPSPGQIAMLAKASLYLTAGVPFEHHWMDRIRSVNSHMKVLDTTAGISDAEHAGHEDHVHDSDPHIWTSPALVMHQLPLIRDELTALKPEMADYFQANMERFQLDLKQLDDEIADRLDKRKGAAFMVFHPAWGHFAERYGLRQIAIEKNRKSPGAKTLAELVNQAKSNQVRFVLIQPQFDQRIAAQLAQAVNAELISIDPLAEDYIDNMRSAAAAIETALYEPTTSH